MLCFSFYVVEMCCTQHGDAWWIEGIACIQVHCQVHLYMWFSSLLVKIVNVCTPFPSRDIWWAWSLCAGPCGIHQVLCEELASKAADLQTEKDDLTQVYNCFRSSYWACECFVSFHDVECCDCEYMMKRRACTMWVLTLEGFYFHAEDGGSL